jgi:hypothetical protein
MKWAFLITLLVCETLLTFRSYAEQGGSGHYVSGEIADFSGTIPTQPGWVFANYFLNYNDGTFSGAKELPLGGVLAADVTANYSAVVPVAIYAYPLDFRGGTLIF